MSSGGTASRAVVHDERLRVPTWWWAAGLAAVVLFGAQLHAGFGGARAVLAYGVVAVLVAGALLASAARIRVADGELQAGQARLPLGVVGAVHVLDREQTRRALGPEADPSAYTVFRAWVPGSVLVELDDPEDPTPYWLLSTRRPRELAAALQRGARAG